MPTHSDTHPAGVRPHVRGATRSLTLGALITTTIAGAALVLGSTVAFSYARGRDVTAAYEQQAELTRLAGQLESASDLLTGEVRAYAQFGDTTHRAAYWREVRETRTRDRVIARLQALGAPPQELALLARAKESSDGLIALEQRAMDLTAAGDHETARRLLFGPEYAGEKARIMAPIGEFRAQLAARTTAGVARATTALRTSYVVLCLVALALLLAIAVTFRRRVAAPLRALGTRMGHLAAGDLTHEAPVRARDEIGQLTESFNHIVVQQRLLAEAAHRVAAGDVSRPVAARGDADVLAHAFERVRTTVAALASETRALTDAARQGDISARGDAAAFRGAYAELVAGINATLDAVAAPVAEAGAVLERVAAHDLSARMTGEYRGAFASMQTALNTAVGNLDAALAQVHLAAEQVAAAGGQIASGSQALAAGASEQAASLEEASASLAELRGSAVQNSERAGTASAGAAGARDSLQARATEMLALREAVARIARSSEEGGFCCS